MICLMNTKLRGEGVRLRGRAFLEIPQGDVLWCHTYIFFASLQTIAAGRMEVGIGPKIVHLEMVKIFATSRWIWGKGQIICPKLTLILF